MINVSQFWDFMIARETIRLRRLAGASPSEWTADPIFQTCSFTNVKRSHDRVTALLMAEFYTDHQCIHPSPEALLNAAIFRYHGTIASARAHGWTNAWDSTARQRMIDTNAARMALGNVFTSAYIIPSCGDPRPKREVVADIIDSIWSIAEQVVSSTTSWQVLCDRLKIAWGVGSFMAKEMLLDYFLICGWEPDDWQTWTPVGPGARRGAAIVKHSAMVSMSERNALGIIRELYAGHHEYWPATYVKLDLTDIQFQLCEFAKYVKVQNGAGRPRRKFRPTIDDVTYQGSAGA